ncbi:MAG TPA: hypothetical protein VIL27_05460, partial [Clostridia bacterium]
MTSTIQIIHSKPKAAEGSVNKSEGRIKEEGREREKPMKTLKKKRFISFLLVSLVMVLVILPATSTAAPLTVDLGTTSSFAVLAGTEITNTGPTTISGSLPEGGGNVGVYAGTTFTGQSSVTMTGWTAYL